MKVKGKLIFKNGSMAKIIAQSLEPDNLSEKTIIKGSDITVIFSSDKLSTMLSSVDDYLMNARIAKDIIEVINSCLLT